MGKINLSAGGGVGPYTVIIREVNELSGNRYTGTNPTSVLTNLDVNYIKDGRPHMYSVNINNGTCSDGASVFEMTCPCEIVPSFVASQVCTNPSDPEISVTTSMPGGAVRIQIFNAGNNVLVHDITTAPGTQVFPVNNNTGYRISVSSGFEGFENCKATDQIVNVACSVPCSLSVSVSNPTC